MGLPDLSNSMHLARLRYIQSIHESADRRNPDTLVRHFIPIFEQWRIARLGREELSKLRADPFYYYLVARTKYYDQIVQDAVSGGVQQIVSIGCGSDTRAHRFEQILRSRRVRVLECDQPELINAKQRIAKRRWCLDQVEYLPVDLNDNAWPDLEHFLVGHRMSKILVLMEGVSPYINDNIFARFLRFLATTLPAGSQVAYDFKLRGINDSFGCAGRTQRPFRLLRAREDVVTFHEAHGLRLEDIELSSELCARLLPGFGEFTALSFGEDALVRLQVERATAESPLPIWGSVALGLLHLCPQLCVCAF